MLRCARRMPSCTRWVGTGGQVWTEDWAEQARPRVGCSCGCPCLRSGRRPPRPVSTHFNNNNNPDLVPLCDWQLPPCSQQSCGVLLSPRAPMAGEGHCGCLSTGDCQLCPQGASVDCISSISQSQLKGNLDQDGNLWVHGCRLQPRGEGWGERGVRGGCQPGVRGECKCGCEGWV